MSPTLLAALLSVVASGTPQLAARDSPSMTLEGRATPRFLTPPVDLRISRGTGNTLAPSCDAVDQYLLEFANEPQRLVVQTERSRGKRLVVVGLLAMALGTFSYLTAEQAKDGLEEGLGKFLAYGLWAGGAAFTGYGVWVWADAKPAAEQP